MVSITIFTLITVGMSATSWLSPGHLGFPRPPDTNSSRYNWKAGGDPSKLVHPRSARKVEGTFPGPIGNTQTAQRTLRRINVERKADCHELCEPWNWITLGGSIGRMPASGYGRFPERDREKTPIEGDHQIHSLQVFEGLQNGGCKNERNAEGRFGCGLGLRDGAEKGRSMYPDQSRGTDTSTTRTPLDESIFNSTGSGCVLGLENRLPVGRSLPTPITPENRPGKEADSCPFHGSDESERRTTLRSQIPDRRGLQRRNRAIREDLELPRNPRRTLCYGLSHVKDRGHSQGFPSRHVRSTDTTQRTGVSSSLHCPLLQERSPQGSLGVGRGWNHRPSDDRAVREAPEPRRRANLGRMRQVCPEPLAGCSSTRNAEGNHSTLKALPPLYAKKTGRLCRDRLLQKFRTLGVDPGTVRRVQEALRYTWDEELYERLLREKPRLDEPMPARADDVRIQVIAGHVEEATDVKAMCHAFTVQETKQKPILPGESISEEDIVHQFTARGWKRMKRVLRRRPILWPKIHNDSKFPMPDISLPRLEEIIAQTKVNSWYMAFDLVASFFQIILDPSVRPYFCFKCEDGSVYQYTVLPMGFYASCEILQALNEALVECARITSKVSKENVPSLVYIDNARFGPAADPDVCKLLATDYVKHGTDVGLLFSIEDGNELHQEGDFCGVHYLSNSDHATVRLPAIQIGKVIADVQRLIAPRASVKTLEEVISRLFWASRVLHLDLAPFFYCLRFASRIARKLAKGGISRKGLVNIPSSIKTLFGRWGALIRLNNPVEVTEPHKNFEFFLATDASRWGYGYVLINRSTGEVFSGQGEWLGLNKTRSINELETVAARRALYDVQDIVKAGPVAVFIDNTSAESALRKGRSKSFYLNKRVLETLSIIRKSNGILHRVKSKENPADPLSRNGLYDQLLTINFIAAATTKMPSYLSAQLRRN